jgi:hypothetical protein
MKPHLQREPDLQIAGLSVWVHGREFPESTDYWDGNWLRVSARCSYGGATVSVDGPLIRLNEIVGLMRGCEQLYATLSGDAALSCMEPNITVSLKAKTGGHVGVHIKLISDMGAGGQRSIHEFTDSIDQTYLPAVIASCQAILAAYPLREPETVTLTANVSTTASLSPSPPATKLNITYELVGTGWARCVIADEESRCEITASYLSDALGRLLLAALGIVSGLRAVSFSFDEEPGEHRWVIRPIDINEIEIQVLQFDQLWGNKPDSDGRLLFKTRCHPVIFARAVEAAATATLRDYGESGYREKWDQHAFPVEVLNLLTAALALPQNAD